MTSHRLVLSTLGLTWQEEAIWRQVDGLSVNATRVPRAGPTQRPVRLPPPSLTFQGNLLGGPLVGRSRDPSAACRSQQGAAVETGAGLLLTSRLRAVNRMQMANAQPFTTNCRGVTES